MSTVQNFIQGANAFHTLKSWESEYFKIKFCEGHKARKLCFSKVIIYIIFRSMRSYLKI